MLDLRLVAASVAMLVALMSMALAEPGKDQPDPPVQASSEARPLRVILPAPWEPSKSRVEQDQASK
jgi:hypothetical protein